MSQNQLNTWSKWLPFPDPQKGEYIFAPFGPGVYELRLAKDRSPILFGSSRNIAFRMTSLLSKSAGGQGNRNKKEKQEFVANYIDQIQYRTLPCRTEREAKNQELLLKQSKEFLFAERKAKRTDNSLTTNH